MRKMSIRAAVAFRQMCELSEAELCERQLKHLPNVSVKLERIDEVDDPLNLCSIKQEKLETFQDVFLKTEDVRSTHFR